MDGKMKGQDLKTALGADLDVLLEEVAGTMNQARAGKIIADSEEGVRDAAAEFRRLDAKATISAYRKQISRYPAAYLEWFDSKIVPAARKAGLPE